MDEMTFGMDFDQYEAERGPQPPSPGEHVFRVTRTSDLKAQSKGENAGAKCFTAWCEALEGGEPSGKGIGKFLGFGTNKDRNGRTQVGEFIAFYEDIGRTDLLRNDATPDELLNTEFSAEVKISAKGNAYLVKCEALDESAKEEVEETEETEEEVDDTPPPQAAKRRGRK